MRMTLAVMVLILASCINTPAAHAQKRTTTSPFLGWDLSYSSVLERNNVSRAEFLWKWLAQHPRSPIEKLLLRWRGGLILSSILMEKPSFRTGERFTLWFVRTRTR